MLQSIREHWRTLDFPFETIAAKFRMIETPLVPVIVPYAGSDGDDNRAERLIRQLEREERPSGIARALQPYVVQIPPRARASLRALGAAAAVRENDFDEQFVVLENLDLYSDETGLSWDDPTFREAESLLF